MELAVLIKMDSETENKLIGRIVMRKIKEPTRTADSAVIGRFPYSLGVDEERTVVYASIPDQYVKEAMNAFLPAAGKIMGFELTGCEDVSGTWPDEPPADATNCGIDPREVDESKMPKGNWYLSQLVKGSYFHLLVEDSRRK